MIKKKKIKSGLVTIAINKRIRYEYFIEKEFEAGIALLGWEVKSLRNGNANINDSYIFLRNSEAFLFGATFHPLKFASSHIICDPMRNRKLLLKQRELDMLFGKAKRDGYTIIALSIYWKNAWAKIKIGVAKGKKEHDKRNSIKEREWKLNKERIMKHNINH